MDVKLKQHFWPAKDARATLLIVHGMGEYAARWQHVGSYFADKGYDVFAYDLRGHGGSGGPRMDLHDFSEHLDDLQRMVDQVQDATRPLFIYGHSMGGLIATHYALSERPQPAGYILSAPALQANASWLLQRAAHALARVWPAKLLKSPVRGEQLSSDPEVQRQFKTDPMIQHRGTARFGALLLEAMETARARVSEIALPVLVLHGKGDTLVPPEASAVFVGQPNVKRELFDGLRHELQNEGMKGLVFDAVEYWLEGQLR